jgi:hypothetical protein
VIVSLELGHQKNTFSRKKQLSGFRSEGKTIFAKKILIDTGKGTVQYAPRNPLKLPNPPISLVCHETGECFEMPERCLVK